MHNSQDNRLHEGEQRDVGDGTHQFVHHTVLRKVVAIVLVHQRLNAHEEDTPHTDNDEGGAPKHFSAAVHFVVPHETVVLVNPLDQVIKHLKRGGRGLESSQFE